MQTYFLNDEEILSFSRHFLSVLGFWRSAVGNDANLIANQEVVRNLLSRIHWVPVGSSGTILFRYLFRAIREFLPDNSQPMPSLTNAKYDRQTQSIEFGDGNTTSTHETNFGGLQRRLEQSDTDKIVLLDMGIHTGKTMHEVYKVLKANVHEKPIVTFSIYLKQGAIMVPSYWGFMVNPEDRVHTPSRSQHNEFPVNRLEHCDHSAGIMLVKCDDSLEFGGRGDSVEIRTYTRYDNTKGKDVYWCAEHQQHLAMVGFMICDKVCRIDSLRDTVDTIAAPPKAKLHLTLLRWVETCARHQGCEWLKLIPSETFLNDFFRMGFRFDMESGYHRIRITYAHAATCFKLGSA